MSKAPSGRFVNKFIGMHSELYGSNFALTFFGTLWCVPVLMTIFGVNQELITLVTLFISLLCLGLMIKSPSSVLIGLPFFALLAPAGGFFKLAGISAVITDWVMFCLGLSIVVLYRRKTVGEASLRLGEALVNYLRALSFVYLVSFIVGLMFGSLISFAPLYYLFSYFVIYYYFDRFAMSHARQQMILDAWCFAAFLGSLILLDAYWEGKSLVSFATDEYDYIIDRFQIEHLFQATYYYSGFHFVIGILSAGLLVRLVFSNEHAWIKAIIVGLLAAFFMVMTVSLNKTTIVSVIVSLSVAYSLVAIRTRRVNVFYMAAVVLAFGYFIYELSEQFAGILFGSSDEYLLSLTSTGSLSVRFEVWINALSELYENPWFIPFGLGPNAIEAGNQEIASAFKTSVVTRQVEGALDSTWLTYLVEFGIFGFVIIGAFFYHCLVRGVKSLEKLSAEQVTKPVLTMTLCGLFYLPVGFISQSLGYAKISWFAFIILLIASSYNSAALSRK